MNQAEVLRAANAAIEKALERARCSLESEAPRAAIAQLSAQIGRIGQVLAPLAQAAATEAAMQTELRRYVWNLRAVSAMLAALRPRLEARRVLLWRELQEIAHVRQYRECR